MTTHKPHPLDVNADAPPGCHAFERTLGLIDELLEESMHEEALAHAQSCALCGPLVEGWPLISDALRSTFEDAAEAAKPDFRALTDRVMERVHPPAPANVGETPKRGFLEFARRAQAWLLLGATTAALALVIPSLLGPQSVEEGQASEQEEPPVMVVRDLAFGADTSGGMVYRTPRGGMTVIWVTENEGA